MGSLNLIVPGMIARNAFESASPGAIEREIEAMSAITVRSLQTLSPHFDSTSTNWLPHHCRHERSSQEHRASQDLSNKFRRGRFRILAHLGGSHRAKQYPLRLGFPTIVDSTPTHTQSAHGSDLHYGRPGSFLSVTQPFPQRIRTGKVRGRVWLS